MATTCLVKKLCTRLLNGHGGVGLGKSLLTSEDGERGGDNVVTQVEALLVGVYVESVAKWIGAYRMWLLQQKKLYYQVRRFFHACIDHFQLTIAILDRSDIRAGPVDYSPASYRKAAYKHFILYHHGYLGRGTEK